MIVFSESKHKGPTVEAYLKWVMIVLTSFAFACSGSSTLLCLSHMCSQCTLVAWLDSSTPGQRSRSLACAQDPVPSRASIQPSTRLKNNCRYTFIETSANFTNFEDSPFALASLLDVVEFLERWCACVPFVGLDDFDVRQLRRIHASSRSIARG